MVDLDAAIILLQKVKNELTVSLNGGSEPSCGNCLHWEDTRTGKKPYGVCMGVMANCKTSNRLLTMPEFCCRYHEPQEPD